MRATTSVGRHREIDAISTSIAAGKSVLLSGPAGVGKSHIATRIAGRLTEDGWRVQRLSGGPAMQTVHLGAVQPLLPRSMSRTPAELFTNAEQELRGLAESAPTLVVIDDLHQVDPASAALLRHLCTAGIMLLATVREESAADPFVLAMWTEGLLERIDVEPLGERDSDELVHELLLEGTTPAVCAAVYALASGNPLFTRELIADACQSGTLAQPGSGWELTGALRAERRVGDLFVARLTALDIDQREALEAIALAERLPVVVAGQVAVPGTLEQLQAMELIDVVDGYVRCSHPMLTEVTGREVPSLRAERLITRLIDALLSSPKSTPADVLRAVRWQLQRGDTPAPLVARAAALQALAVFDGPLAVQCAHAAFAPDSPQAHALLGRAQFIAQDLESAVATLGAGVEIATTDEDRAVTSVALSEVLAFGTGDFAGAAALLERAMASISAAPHRAMCAGTLSLVRALVGDFSPALDYGDELLASHGLDESARLNLLLMWTVAAASSGRVENTQQRLDEARDLAQKLRPVMPAALDQVLAAQLIVDTADGRMSDGYHLAAVQRRIAGRDSRLTAIWDNSLALVEVMAGRGISAVAHSKRARADIANGDPLGVRPLVLATQAMTEAATGDAGAAMAAHDLSTADPRCGPREQAFLARARGHVLAFNGDVHAAVTELQTGAADSGDGFVWAGWALYDAVRFDRAGDVATELATIASKAPVETILAMTDHCDALVGSDAARLAKAAERLARAGLALFAAEAGAHASRQLGYDGDATGAALMALRSLAFFEQCDGVRSLAVESLRRPLTDREHEVALAAAAGKTSQVIADELFVSRRTVDNHLQNAYRKLGINQRDELTHALNVNIG